MWDAFAVSTYLTISALFWTMGLIPDIANAREAAMGWRKKFYTVAGDGLAGYRPPMAPLLDGVLANGGISYSARAVGAFGRVMGFRDGDKSRLA